MVFSAHLHRCPGCSELLDCDQLLEMPDLPDDYYIEDVCLAEDIEGTCPNCRVIGLVDDAENDAYDQGLAVWNTTTRSLRPVAVSLARAA